MLYPDGRVRNPVQSVHGEIIVLTPMNRPKNRSLIARLKNGFLYIYPVKICHSFFKYLSSLFGEAFLAKIKRSH
jgi:hypothetical protein